MHHQTTTAQPISYRQESVWSAPVLNVNAALYGGFLGNRDSGSTNNKYSLQQLAERTILDKTAVAILVQH
jgi:hypothetical protein